MLATIVKDHSDIYIVVTRCDQYIWRRGRDWVKKKKEEIEPKGKEAISRHITV
jgi:hypothetical protein